MFSLREKLVAVYTVNGFCNETLVDKAIQKAYQFLVADPRESVKTWYNTWYGNAL